MGSTKLTASRLHQLLRYYPHTGIFTRLTDNGRGCRVGDVAGTLHKRSGYINMYVDGANSTAPAVVSKARKDARVRIVAKQLMQPRCREFIAAHRQAS